MVNAPAAGSTPSEAMETLAGMLLPALQNVQTKQWGRGLKHDASGTPITVGYTHGPGGNLTFPGVDPAVFHTAVGNRGIIGQLPAMPSVYTNPLFEVVTGVQADTGSNKNNVCDNAPTAGLMKAGMLSSVFGRYERASPEMEVNRLGARNDRGDPLDLTLVGSPIDAGGPFAQGPRSPGYTGDVLTNEIARKMWELNVSLHRLLSQQTWTGNPVNNSAGGGYKEMTGLSLLINTGHKDAETGIALPSIDSDVKDFGSKRIDGSAANGTEIVHALSYILATRRDLAERTGVSPVRWVFAMRPELFWELSAIYPCSYLTYRCQTQGNERLVIDSGDQIRFRDEMRQGRYLLVNGERLDVILDDGIPFDDGNESGAMPRGCFRSDIYLIPMSVGGGRAVTYLEYFDHGNASIQAALEMGVLGRADGPWFVTPRQTNTCFVFQAKIESRLILRTPWLAGRLKNVVYCPMQAFRQPFPSDPYFVDGGRTSRQGPSYYNIWA